VPKPISVAHALEKIRHRKALLLGDMLLDAYVYGETVRVSREAPVLIVRKEKTEYKLGGAANTAANLLALGMQVHVVGAVGGDAHGHHITRLLQGAAAHTQHIITTEHATAVKTRILAGAFGTSRQQVLRLDEEPETPLSPTTLADMAQEVENLASQVDVVVVSDYANRCVSGPVVEAVRNIARKGVLVCVDSRFKWDAFTGVTAITPNIPEAESAVGFAITQQEAVEHAGRILLERLQCASCLLTQGKHGMTLLRAHHSPFHTDAAGVQDVTDVTGAGDTVIATFSAALASGLSMENATLLANCAAGIVVTKMGTATASPSEIVAAAETTHTTLLP
jgi:rfaE bifunctional protein kinase chain/domain